MRAARYNKAAIRPTSVDDPTVNKALSEIRDAVPDVAVFDGARLIKDIVLASGVTKRVVHGLGRKYRGRIIARQSTNAYLIDDYTRTDTDTYIYLTASANTTVSLVVF